MDSPKIIISSSIENFKDKILSKNIQWPGALFIGLYHPKDYQRFIDELGKKTVFWCGSDILNLKEYKETWLPLIINQVSDHLCENDVERKELESMGIKSSIHPVFFGDVNKYQVTYKCSEVPNVWMCAHPGREEEYGVYEVVRLAKLIPEIIFHIYGIEGESKENLIYHGKVSEEQLDEEIKNYQSGLRLNKFDGFSEVIAKSILNGQWPMSKIGYEDITLAGSDPHLMRSLKKLSTRKEPDIKSRDYWFSKLKYF